MQSTLNAKKTIDLYLAQSLTKNEAAEEIKHVVLQLTKQQT